MNDEMASLHDKDTYELVDLPNGVNAIPVKWVYKLEARRIRQHRQVQGTDCCIRVHAGARH